MVFAYLAAGVAVARSLAERDAKSAREWADVHCWAASDSRRRSHAEDDFAWRQRFAIAAWPMRLLVLGWATWRAHRRSAIAARFGQLDPATVQEKLEAADRRVAELEKELGLVSPVGGVSRK
jgi:hypothetical protein